MNEQTVPNEQALAIPVTQKPAAPVMGATIWNTPALMGEVYRMAEMLSGSDILPQSYRNNPGNCVVAIDMANRMGISPLMVMQNSQMVYGNFTWKGSACKAMVDGCGKYRNSRYEGKGEQGKPDWGFRLVVERVSTGETVYGPWVTWQMAQNEGWVDRKDKNGNYVSKWRTMPELMMKYRAASFFAKSECPEILMGFQTAEEAADIPHAVANTPEAEYVICEDCKQAVTPTKRASVAVIINHSKDKFDGKVLCADCQRKRKREAKQKPVETPVDAPEPQDEWNTAPTQETPQNGDTGEMEPL